jgi:hypothetical protein
VAFFNSLYLIFLEMPQVTINSVNIATFGYSATMDIYARTLTFDISTLTTFNGGGAALVQGIAFSVEDSQGVMLAQVDFTAPQIPAPIVDDTWVLDLSSIGYPFLFQKYKIIAQIKDEDGTIYTVEMPLKEVCIPKEFQDVGYVYGTFLLEVNCPGSILTVKELTNLTYVGKDYDTLTKTGTLNYPTGTIAAVSFTGTPFTNNVIYTGQYRINCTTVATYDFGDDFYISVTYITKQNFDINCSDKISDVLCCLVEKQKLYDANCDNSIGKNAASLLAKATMPLLIGLAKEFRGEDASDQAKEIRKILACDCGKKGIKHNEVDPVTPNVYSIVLNGVGDTSMPSTTIVGNTKTFVIASNIYQVVKGDTGDLAYTIAIDTATQYTVKYKLTFDYEQMAAYIYSATADSAVLLQQLNNLISAAGIDLTGFDGKCIIDTSTANYSVAQSVTGSTLLINIVINGTIYNAPSNLFANNAVSVQNWLNSLTLGTFSAVVGGGTLTIISLNNANVLSTVSFTSPTSTKMFASTSVTVTQILQAIVDYLCGLTIAQVKLDRTLHVCTLDYNSEVVETSYAAGTLLSDFLVDFSNAYCDVVEYISELTGVTCEKIQAVFSDNATAVLDAADRILAKVDGACTTITPKQLAKAVIDAINAFSDLKTEFCAIDCSEPGTCPEVSAISLAMAGANIGLYGITWETTPSAVQTVSVYYKLSSSGSYTLATNSLQILPNGNISGTTPFTISGVVAGSTYDVRVINNCGGVGFQGQITVPSSSVFSDSFLLDSDIYNICGNSPVTLYSSSAFAVGVTMYTNIGLTVPVTGYDYIANSSTGEIFYINSGTGVVGISTGLDCDTGTAGTYILSNNTGTICTEAQVTLYTNGAFTVGGTLYTDQALSNPVTGYSYVLNGANNHIYNLNSGTGVIGSDTSLTCGVYSGSYVQDNTAAINCSALTTTLYSSAPFGTGVTLYQDIGLTIPATGFTHVLYVDPFTFEVFDMNPLTAVVGIQVANCVP